MHEAGDNESAQYAGDACVVSCCNSALMGTHLLNHPFGGKEGSDSLPPRIDWSSHKCRWFLSGRMQHACRRSLGRDHGSQTRDVELGSPESRWHAVI